MAPSYANADLSYRQAVSALTFACKQLECHLPSDDATQADISLTIPSYRPQRRGLSVSACPQCAIELEQLEAGAREGYQCTHQVDTDEVGAQGAGVRRPDDVGDTVRRRQPNAGVIRQDLVDIKEKYDGFVKAISTLIAVCENQEEKESFEQHLIVWAEYVADVRSRAAEVLQILEAPVDRIPAQHIQQTIASTGTTGAMTSTTYTANQLAAAILAGTSRQVHDQQVTSAADGLHSVPVSNSVIVSQPGVSDNMVVSTGTGAATPSRPLSLELDLAIKSFEHICTTIYADLTSMEQDMLTSAGHYTEAFLADMKDFSSSTEIMINKDMKEAAEKVARLDTDRVSGIPGKMAANLTDFTRRLRATQASIRRARTIVLCTNSSSTDTSGSVSRESTPSSENSRGYKSYLEKLKPPTFSGRVEDWPEFRAVWNELLGDVPESIQVQHVRNHLPAADAKKVSGVKTMEEVWQRLERVYGDRELNILTVKSNLENFSPKSAQDHRKLQEVYEVVERAVTQLQNLDALRYLKEDCGLMNK